MFRMCSFQVLLLLVLALSAGVARTADDDNEDWWKELETDLENAQKQEGMLNDQAPDSATKTTEAPSTANLVTEASTIHEEPLTTEETTTVASTTPEPTTKIQNPTTIVTSEETTTEATTTTDVPLMVDSLSDDNSTIEADHAAGGNGTSNDTFVGPVPVNVAERSTNEQPKTNESVAAALGMGQNVHETTVPMSHTIIKYSIIGALLLVPVIMLPIILLFTRRRAIDDGGDKGPVPEGGGFRVPYGYPSIRNLQDSVTLLPANRSNANSKREPVVPRDDESVISNLCFFLAKNDTWECMTNGMLFHPLSGLLFNPIPAFKFDPASGKIVHVQSGIVYDSWPNYVYNPDSNQLYEKCYCMKFDPATEKFSLPHAKPNANEFGVRFLRPDELPPEFVPIYLDLYYQRLRASPTVPPALKSGVEVLGSAVQNSGTNIDDEVTRYLSPSPHVMPTTTVATTGTDTTATNPTPKEPLKEEAPSLAAKEPGKQ